jgi:hypothetical protein
MSFYILKPQQCGGFGRKTLYGGELTDRPPAIYRLDFEFTAWPIDDLIEFNCTYIATERLIAELSELNPKPVGIFYDTVTINTTYEMRQAQPGLELATYKWCKINGRPGKDDFAMSADHHLVISSRALVVIKPKLTRCIIEVYNQGQAASKP